MTDTRYKVVTALSPDGLDQQVNMYCHLGWEPHGSPLVTPTHSDEPQRLVQAMVRKAARDA